MSLLQEAAIVVGDHVTQPIRVKAAELITGRRWKVEKQILEGALMENGHINPLMKPGPREPVHFADHRNTNPVPCHPYAKRVTWKLVESL